MTEKVVPTLVGDRGIGFLAALGVLHLFHHAYVHTTPVRMKWLKQNNEWIPAYSGAVIPEDNFAFADMVYHAAKRLSKELLKLPFMSEQRKGRKKENARGATEDPLLSAYRNSALMAMSKDGGTYLRGVKGYISEWLSVFFVDVGGSSLQRSLFYFYGGKQDPFVALENLNEKISPLLLHEQLFIDWGYYDQAAGASFRLDPAEFAMHAYQAYPPETETEHKRIAAGIMRLAGEGLCAFPTYLEDASMGQLTAPGIRQEKGEPLSLRYPLWQKPLSWDAVRLLLAQPIWRQRDAHYIPYVEVIDSPNFATLKDTFEIGAVFETQIVTVKGVSGRYRNLGPTRQVL